MAANVITGVVYEQSGATLMARILGHSGATVTQASLSSISYEVWQIYPAAAYVANKFQIIPPAELPTSSSTPPVKRVAATSLTPADVIYDALQVDSKWTVDDTGYNFAVAMPAASFAAIPIADWPESTWYEVPVKFTPTSGAVFHANFFVDCRHLLMGK